jgi:hypothetical protein
VSDLEDPVAGFTVAAERFCALIESDWRLRGDLLFAELARALACLYAAATKLPDIELDSDDLPDQRSSHVQWQAAFWPIAAALRKDDFYWDVEPNREETPEVVGRLLTDELGDVYRDVKEGLLLRDSGVPDTDVLWQWRFEFWSHWGAHAIGALGALHSRLAEAGGGRYDPADYSPR